VSLIDGDDRHVALPLSPDEGRFCLFSVRFSADGNEILGGANDGAIYLFDRMAQVRMLCLHICQMV
jgi:WD repeat-containing protein 23